MGLFLSMSIFYGRICLDLVGLARKQDFGTRTRDLGALRTAFGVGLWTLDSHRYVKEQSVPRWDTFRFWRHHSPPPSTLQFGAIRCNQVQLTAIASPAFPSARPVQKSFFSRKPTESGPPCRPGAPARRPPVCPDSIPCASFSASILIHFDASSTEKFK
jgi:hypothetical protein